MHMIPEHFAVLEQAPSTDAEWAESLQSYGRDRDGPESDGTPQAGPSRPHRPLIPRRGLEASDESDIEDIDPTASMRERKRRAFGVSGLISSPPVCTTSDEDKWDGAEERRRMRESYEKQGWLGAPTPSLKTKGRRRRVIRRLGLAGSAEADHERRMIIVHYMELAKLAFQADDVAFGIMRDDEGYRYTLDSAAEPMLCEAGGTALLQLAVKDRAECTVMSLLKDWRTKANPVLQPNDEAPQFFAAAPLLYARADPPVAFGCIAIMCKSSRTTFSEREQAMLLQMSSMLVYQLATFQSELLAESAAGMYEKSLAFLRRSIIPNQSAPSHGPTPRKKNPPEIKTRRGRSKRDKAVPETARTDPLASPFDAAEAELPPLVVKAGPKEQLDARRRWQANNLDLHQDAAETLRGIVEADALAVIDMEDYQLYYRQTGSDTLELDKAASDPANMSPLSQFLQGQGWPEDLQPIVQHVSTSMTPRSPLLASSADDPHTTFTLTSPAAEATICELLVNYLQTRRFWWDRDSPPDSLGARLMAFCPSSAETALAHFMLRPDGKIQHLMLATWNRPPSSFAHSSALALPFVQVLGGLSLAALNFRKVRAIETSQISYSNLQAHELRTPLHQILAITQVLRSTMIDLAEAPASCDSYTSSLQQIRDLIPILDAIDTSGKTLHGIVDNILSFLDLKSKDASTPNSPRIPSASGANQKLLVDMLEEVVVQAHEDNERSRRSALQSLNSIETIFEIDPPSLGTDYMEDSDGALRRALTKILSNAYKFIEGEGCVEIKLSNLVGPNAPKNCQGVCMSRKVMIEIKDNGPGMTAKFVRDHLGEPWAKQDAFTTGSGLSVHLAYRIIEMMGGCMEVHSAPGRGCLVRLEVPVMNKATIGIDGLTAADAEASKSARQKVALVGFNIPGRENTGLWRLGETLREHYRQHGAMIVDISEADIVVANGEVEEVPHGRALMENAKAGEIIFLTMPDHDPHPEVVMAAQRHSRSIRRYPKPVTPSIIRQTLLPRPARAQSQSQHLKYRSSESEGRRTSASSGISSPSLGGAPKAVKIDEAALPISSRPGAHRTSQSMDVTSNWRPKGMCIMEAIANLSLGDYFSATRRVDLKRTTSRGSDGGQSTPGTVHSELMEGSSLHGTPDTSVGGGGDSSGVLESPMDVLEPEQVKVLVVEDNLINRKILVKILSKLPVDVIEAADGVEAVEQFTALGQSKTICLLDINMPNKDGYQACQEMRDMEKADPHRSRAEIIAVTALSADDEKRKGWKAGFDEWAVKPCGKAKITKLVETARKKLLGIMEEPDPEMERRYTI